MGDWNDFNGDGEVDIVEQMMTYEMLCTSREEHIAQFGDSGDWGDEDESRDLEFELEQSGLDVYDLADMDYDERCEAIEDAGLDPDDFDNF